MTARRRKAPPPALWRLLLHVVSRTDALLAGALAVVVVASALVVVRNVHEVRLLVAAVHDRQGERMALLEQRGRLLLERSAWSSYGRVEELARADLGMLVPAPEGTRMVRLADTPDAAPGPASAGGAP